MSRMHQLLLDAAQAHPERAEYEAAVAKGVDPERAARLLAPQPPLELTDGRTVWRVQNNPQRLEAHATAVAKCPAFKGKKTPKPRAPKGGGETYRHPELGFKLFVPQNLITTGESVLEIGVVKLTLKHTSKTIKGAVPRSWLEDLNAGHCEAELVEEEASCCVEDLL